MKPRVLSKIERIIKKQGTECYVLMFCNKTNDEELLVEMSYDGDEALGCYMLENALSILDKKARDKSPNDELPQ